MEQFRTLALVLAGCAALGACSRTEAPEPIRAQPVFDKYGVADCRPSGQPINSTYPEQIPPCEPDECEGTYTVGATQIPCPPPRRDDRDPQQPGGTGQPNNPTGGPIN